MRKPPITRRRLLLALAGLLAAAGCENRPPIVIEGKGGSSTKPKVKVKVLY